jgi:hypothetical protein
VDSQVVRAVVCWRRAGGTDISSPAIGSSDHSDLKGLRPITQSYVGKSPISKGIGSIIRRFVLSPVMQDVPEPQRRAFSKLDWRFAGWWRRERIADFGPKCSNPPRWTPGTRCDEA